jgi:hypothetical protein
VTHQLIALKYPRKTVRFQEPYVAEDLGESEDTATYREGHKIDTERIAHDLDDSNAVVHFDIDPQNSIFTFLPAAMHAENVPGSVTNTMNSTCGRV